MSESPTTPPLPRSGDTIAGRYRVDHVIGTGGMGCVLSAEHLLLRTRVAIKLLLPQAAAWPGATERFLREAQAAAALRGEHVARVVDMGTIESGAPFMVMEYLQGRDLQKVIQERAPLSVLEAVEYLLQVCDALHEAHAAGILHRDIKPANIFVTTRPNGTPLLKVLDFGLAKVRAQANSAAPEVSITQTGQIIGSPHYMPPEQFRGLRHADARSDIWALGVVFYELLTGRRPFTGEGTGGVMASIFSDDPVPLPILRPDVPPALADLVMACLEKRPDRRPQEVATLLSTLELFVPRRERTSQAWIDPSAPPSDSASRSAAVSYGPLPPPGAGTVRIGAGPLPSTPDMGIALLRSGPAISSAPLPPSGQGIGAAPSISATPDRPSPPLLDNTAPNSVSTSAYMGVATPITADGASSSASLSGESSNNLSAPLLPGTGPEIARPARNGRLGWILPACVAGIVAVVGIVARAVVGSVPSADTTSSGEGATPVLAAEPPTISVVPAPATATQQAPASSGTGADPASPTAATPTSGPAPSSSSSAAPTASASSTASPSAAKKGASGPKAPARPAPKGDILDRP